MKSYTAFPVFKTIPESYHLESPVVSGDRFLWVQIHGTPEAGSPGVVHWFDLPEGGFSEDGLDLEINTVELDEPCGAVIPTNQVDTVIVAKERTFHLLNLSDKDVDVATLPQLATVIDDNPLVRLNDCRAGYDGKIYAGTMAYDCETPLGKWGVVDGNDFIPLIEGVKVSNGFGWTAEQTDDDGNAFRTLVYVDSKSGKVDTHDDEANGVTESSEIWSFRHYAGNKLGEKSVLTNITPVAERQVSGCPVVADGGCMAFDDDGSAYFVVAEYNGGAAHIVSVDSGDVVAEIKIPALKITSCCWAGKYLVFTSTREGIIDLSAEDLPADKHEKLAGGGNLFWLEIEGFHGADPDKVIL